MRVCGGGGRGILIEDTKWASSKEQSGVVKDAKPLLSPLVIQDTLNVVVKYDTCDWSCTDSWHYWICMEQVGRMQNTGSYSRLSLPFSFSRLSFLRIRLPFLCLPRWLFSLALLFASVSSCFLLPWLVPERDCFRKPWDFFSLPKIILINSRKISTRQGFKKNKPFVRVTPDQSKPKLKWMVVKSSVRQVCLLRV